MTKTEMYFENQMKLKGWELLHTGWPDFLAVKPNGKAELIELKCYKGKLSKNQIVMHRALKRAFGIKVRVVKMRLDYNNEWAKMVYNNILKVRNFTKFDC